MINGIRKILNGNEDMRIEEEKGKNMDKGRCKRISDRKNRAWSRYIVVCSLLTAMFISAMGVGSVSHAATSDGVCEVTERPESTLFDTSGVAELDSAKERTDSLIKWVCAWVGGIIALVSLIIALVMASSHQQEQRNQALVGLAVGIIIAFAPQVVNYLLGNQG